MYFPIPQKIVLWKEWYEDNDDNDNNDYDIMTIINYNDDDDN